MTLIKYLSLLLAAIMLMLALGLIGIGGFYRVDASDAAKRAATSALPLSRKLYCKKTLMTVAYKAYGNPAAAEGKYWLAKLVMENIADHSLQDVKVSFRIPNYLEWSTPDSFPEVLPKQTCVVPIYPKLPSKVAELRTRTPAMIEVKIQFTDNGRSQEIFEKREFDFRGVNEIEYTSLPTSELVNWYDSYDNYELLAAFNMDQDPVIQAYFGKISETQRGINVPGDLDALIELVQKIYKFQQATNMTYASAKGFPEKSGDIESTVQNIRLPREVVRNNAGLCIELALLMSSLCDAAGAKSKLVMIPGHAFVYVEADNGDAIAFECTGITKVAFADAVKKGIKEYLAVKKGDIDGIIVDLHKHQSEGIRPPELPDVNIAEFKRELADRLASGPRSPNPQPNPDPAKPQPNDPVIIAGDLPIRVAIPFPSDWTLDRDRLANAQRQTPGCRFLATSFNNDAFIRWYYFPGHDIKAFAPVAQKAGITLGAEEKTLLNDSPAIRQSVSFTQNGSLMYGQLYSTDTRAGVVCIFFAGVNGDELKRVIDAALPMIKITPN